MKNWTLAIAVVAIALAGSHAQTESVNGPSLAETEKWIQDTLPDASYDVFDDPQGVDGSRGGYTSASYANIDACIIHLTHVITYKNGSKEQSFEDFSLNAIDPDTIKSDRSSTLGKALVTYSTRNDKPLIKMILSNGKKGNAHDSSVFVRDDYAPRLVKAFKHAVELCGGKASAF